ncbi:hypothetical protein BO99DRAFT_447799 [Aspergillus violaceofuscus CBS 115571]|uniref:Peptidase S1 domain-containing protein n=1 Tax=Aspergillus violaceofuscus (strain CBS 115571) TaxID=1450538 RepID=A0A2V5I0I6_ASPV1|nr:hypothetical protein BO99DRAFT_447799 [Aspergillus violaceofuscus CBS 115571]
MSFPTASIRNLSEMDQVNRVGHGSPDEHRLETDKKKGKFRLGQVFAGSGLRNKHLTTIKMKDPTSTRPSIMDWALIRLVGRATGQNTSLDLKTPSHRFTTLTTAASPPHELRIFELDHATGWTEGQCNNLKLANIAQDEAGDIVVTHEHHFISESSHTGSPVIGPGDSGALVCDDQGRVWGMAFGGDEMGHRGYFTHIVDLFEDIRSALGTEIRLVGQD